MAESSPREPPRAASETVDRAKALAQESAAWLRDETGRMVSDYRRQTKFYKWRSWIVASFLVVAAFSLWNALPQHNGIDAYVAINYDIVSRKALIYVRNDSNVAWTNVTLVADGHYRLDHAQLKPGEHLSADITQFRRAGIPGPKGAANASLRPKAIQVRCDQGAFEQAVAR